MQLQQLKMLAGRIRGLLEQSSHTVTHNQALDLAAALPGLRNWPEVQSFDDRVESCQLDTASATRLAFRLKKHFGLDFSPQALLSQLAPPDMRSSATAPHIWPSGPTPGVYITTSQDAIDALLANYEDATDGALVYAERAGNHFDGSIDLGESGLWSNGLQRVPSGTLIVLGPVKLDQQSWDDSAQSISMACLQALNCDHRVAVLVDTPSPETLLLDLQLMVYNLNQDELSVQQAIMGLVAADGQLVKVPAFATPYQPGADAMTPAPNRPPLKKTGTAACIPSAARALIENQLSHYKTGLLFLGDQSSDHSFAQNLVVDALSMTPHAGPAARIMPRHRSTPSKDWDVSPEIAALPFLPSIQTAYAQGYRRMLIDPTYTSTELLLQYAPDVLFIAADYATDVQTLFINALRGGGFRLEAQMIPLILAFLATQIIEADGATEEIVDLFIGPRSVPDSLSGPSDYRKARDFVQDNRITKWEDQVRTLVESGQMTYKSISQSMPRNQPVVALVEKLGKASKLETL